MEPPSGDTNLAQSAYERVKACICVGTFPMGAKLTEAQLAEEAGVSRTPIRIALSRLEAEGFLTWEPNKGYSVTVFSIEDVREIYGVRALLESEAVRLAGRRGLGSKLAASLTDLTREMGCIVSASYDEAEKRKAYLPLNHQFHSLIYDSCGNRFLLRQIASTADLPLALRNYFNFSAEQLTESHTAHLNILAALKKDEADRAAGLMREHIWAARDRMSVKKTKRQGKTRSRPLSPRGKRILVPRKTCAARREDEERDAAPGPGRASAQ